MSETERAALPWAIARQPLWSIGGWVARLDDEGAARVVRVGHALETAVDVERATWVIDDIDRWVDAFTGA
ncbi:MAG TPA: hypothetical protein VI076_14705 [Actinopolymorphaceae bacterium]